MADPTWWTGIEKVVDNEVASYQICYEDWTLPNSGDHIYGRPPAQRDCSAFRRKIAEKIKYEIKTIYPRRLSHSCAKMELVVDLQDFKRPTNELVPKELAVLEVNKSKSGAEDEQPRKFLFKPPFDWNNLPAKYNTINSWLQAKLSRNPLELWKCPLRSR